MSMNQTSNHYTFGENDLAARRLALLAAAYAAPSRAFLASQGSVGVVHAIDLGCGPGYTTALVQSMLRAKQVTGQGTKQVTGQVTGIDASEKLLAQARARVPDAAFVQHDVTRAPFPCPPADLLFCRFLVTHLDDPGAALRAWAQAARPGARLLIQETAALESDDPIFRRYYEMVGAVQSSYGQSLYIGTTLDRLVASHGWTIVSSELAVVEQAPQVMAQLHGMNIRTWGCDSAAAARFAPDELARVQTELDRIAAGERPAPPVRNALRQVVATI
jgi:trans-aconitate 2-methyltransferase